MRSHVYYIYETLSQFDALQEVNSWGALHQERLNGTGYPFGFHEDDLPLGARIMAVADVFIALTEDRPYRMGMDRKDTLEILNSMTARGDLDQSLVTMLYRNFYEMNSVRKAAQQAATREYDSFHSVINRKNAE